MNLLELEGIGLHPPKQNIDNISVIMKLNKIYETF